MSFIICTLEYNLILKTMSHITNYSDITNYFEFCYGVKVIITHNIHLGYIAECSNNFNTHANSLDMLQYLIEDYIKHYSDSSINSCLR
jgi:hypothetical protein